MAIRWQLGTALSGALVGLAAGGVLLEAPAHAQSPEPASDAFGFSAEEELSLQIIELRLRSRRVLRTDLFAYDVDGALYLPLGEMAFELGFPIEIDASALTAEGWFLRETQIFRLDARAGTVSIAGQSLDFASGDLRSDGQELFVRAETLSRWFRLELDWSARDQRVNLAPDYLLAAEEYDRRSRRLAPGSATRAPRLELEELTEIQADYRLIGPPHGTFDLRAGIGSSARSTLNLGLRGDLLKMTGELFGSIDDAGRTSARLTLGRDDPEARLFSSILGDYGASAFRMGDVAGGAVPLLTENATGLGFSIERRNTRRSDTFDSTRIEGAAPAGWQAELYRDGALLGLVEIGASGLYAFENVPLRFGINRFRIELYGPSGERESEERTVDISNAFIQPGEVEYSLDFVLPGRGVFRDAVSFAEQDFDDAAQPGTAVGNPNAGYLVRGDAAFGLSDTLSGQVGFQYRDDRSTTGLTGLVSAAKRTRGSIFSGALALQDDGDYAIEGGFSTELSGVSLVSRGQVFSSGFGLGQLTAALKSQLNVRLDGRLETGFLRDVAVWSLGARTAQRADGGRDTDVNAQLSGQLGGLSVSQALFWRSSEAGGTSDTRLNGATALSGSIGPWRLRGGIDFDLAPATRVRTIRAEVARRAGDWFFRAGVTSDMQSGSQVYAGSVTRDWNGINLGSGLIRATI